MNSMKATPALRGPVPLSHLILRSFLNKGDLAVDATCGNGHDTLLLVKLVGDSGTVWAFDVQEDAIKSTAKRLSEAGLAGRVKLIHGGHEKMTQHVSAPVSAVIFNLGYLPGGDRSIITRPETTLAAFEQALELLHPGGIVAVTVYPGHDIGAESSTVDAWATNLDPRTFHTWRMGQLNVPTDAPYFILVQKAQ